MFVRMSDPARKGSTEHSRWCRRLCDDTAGMRWRDSTDPDRGHRGNHIEPYLTSSLAGCARHDCVLLSWIAPAIHARGMNATGTPMACGIDDARDPGVAHAKPCFTARLPPSSPCGLSAWCARPEAGAERKWRTVAQLQTQLSPSVDRPNSRCNGSRRAIKALALPLFSSCLSCPSMFSSRDGTWMDRMGRMQDEERVKSDRCACCGTRTS
jgi:hypothetical protein